MLIAKLVDHGKYEGNDLAQLLRTLTKLQNTVNSDQFKDAVLGFSGLHFDTYKCLYTLRRKRMKRKTYTNEEILARILKGRRQEGGDTYMDLKLTWKPGSGGRVVGSTSKDRTTTYYDDFKSFSEERMAAHVMHEWMHVIGFHHSHGLCDPKRDCYSVPYAVGNLVELLLTGECRNDCPYNNSFARL